MTFSHYVPIISLILSIAACLVMKLPLAVALAVTVLITLLTVSRMGFTFRQQTTMGWRGVKQTKPVLIILSLVGILIPLLMMSGTIPGIIYYGLEVVNTKYLLIIAFLLTSSVSYLLGTSVGTLSTAGLALIGIAQAAQVPLGMMAGALISGAMVGERFSPVSSSRILAVSSIDGDERIDRFARKTGIIGFLLTAGIFLILDLVREKSSAIEVIQSYQDLLTSHFTINLMTLLPLVMMILSFVMRVKAVPALALGIASSFVLMLLNRPVQVTEFGKSMLYGLNLQSGTVLDSLVHGGGLINIITVLILISLAGFLNGILQEANLLPPIIDKLMGETKTIGNLVFKSVLLSLFVIIISCNQTIPLLVLGGTLRPRFSAFESGKNWLGRTMLDATLVMPVLVPWNGLAMVMSITLGVATTTALPFLFFSLLLPVITILFAYLTFGNNTDGIESEANRAS